MIYFIYKNLNFNTTNIKLFKNNFKIGTSTISVSNNFTTINDIFIDKKYRKYGYGSLLLNNIENLSINKYNINKISLLAWQPYGSSNVIDFFKKNNYNIIDNNIGLYDDYLTIFELYKFEKNL